MSIRSLCLALLLAPAAAAQTPSEVSLALAAKDGRTQFHQGEGIELQLKFQSTVPGKYAVWTLDAKRTYIKATYDNFLADPAPGVVDPLADGLAQGSMQAYVGPPPMPTPINGGEVTVNLFLNEWFSFRQPGHYRVSVETARLVATADSRKSLPMKSGAYEFEVTPFDPAWAKTELQKAVAVLAIPDLPPGKIGQRGPSFPEIQAAEKNAENAGRIVRFMETPEAARVLVRYLGRGPQYAQAQLLAGLGTPCRKDLIDALNEAVAAPDIPIVRDYYFTLQRFAELTTLGPVAPAPSGSSREEMARYQREIGLPYRERAKPIDDAVTARMITALAHKQGEALAISVATIGGTGLTMPSPALGRALLENLTAMPENTQHQWLTTNWPRIAAPEAEPILKNFASGNTGLRDEALMRLNELDPAAARPIAIDRIRRGDIFRDAYHNERVLLQLPDKTLPDLDDALVANVERGIVNAEVLLARYASPAVADRVKTLLDRNPRRCNGPLIAYLFRVDPDNAPAQLARYRAGIGCTLGDLQGRDDLLMSPALERQLIQDLDAAPTRFSQSNSAASLLQSSGSAAAKEPLMAAMMRPTDEPVPPGGSIESTRIGYVLGGTGWLLTPADFDKLQAACQSDQCRRAVTSRRTELAEPIPVSADASPYVLAYARLGPYMLRSAEQVKAKLAQFPKGTSFYIPAQFAGTWYAQQRTREFQKMIEDAGMKLVPEPPRPPLR